MAHIHSLPLERIWLVLVHPQPVRATSASYNSPTFLHKIDGHADFFTVKGSPLVQFTRSGTMLSLCPSWKFFALGLINNLSYLYSCEWNVENTQFSILQGTNPKDNIFSMQNYMYSFLIFFISTIKIPEYSCFLLGIFAPIHKQIILMLYFTRFTTICLCTHKGMPLCNSFLGQLFFGFHFVMAL